MPHTRRLYRDHRWHRHFTLCITAVATSKRWQWTWPEWHSVARHSSPSYACSKPASSTKLHLMHTWRQTNKEADMMPHDIVQSKHDRLFCKVWVTLTGGLSWRPVVVLDTGVRGLMSQLMELQGQLLIAISASCFLRCSDNVC